MSDRGPATRGSRGLPAAAIALLLSLLPGTGWAGSQPSALDKDDPRSQLSIGYSQLYQEANGIPKLKWILDMKDKTSPMAQLTDGLMTYYQQLADHMKKLSAQYPALRIDAQAMPAIAARTRKAIGDGQAKDMAPLAGKSGIAFERETLLMFYDALNEQRHLVGVMEDSESSPALKRFLHTTRAQLDERHAQVGALLNRRYFTH